MRDISKAAAEVALPLTRKVPSDDHSRRTLAKGPDAHTHFFRTLAKVPAACVIYG